MSVDKMSVDKMSVEKMSVDKMSVDKMSVGKMSVDKMSMDKKSSCLEKHVDNEDLLMVLYFPPLLPLTISFATVLAIL